MLDIINIFNKLSNENKNKRNKKISKLLFNGNILLIDEKIKDNKIIFELNRQYGKTEYIIRKSIENTFYKESTLIIINNLNNKNLLITRICESCKEYNIHFRNTQNYIELNKKRIYIYTCEELRGLRLKDIHDIYIDDMEYIKEKQLEKTLKRFLDKKIVGFCTDNTSLFFKKFYKENYFNMI